MKQRSLLVPVAIASSFALSLWSGSAAAKEPPPPPAASESNGAPEAHRGLQLGLRAGVSIPFGNVTATTAMSDAVGIQVPLILDIGAKPFEHVFLGAYFGIAQGGAAGAIADVCARLGVSCDGLSLRFGGQVHYAFRPAATINPWLGLAIGYEIARSSGTSGKNSVTNRLAGLEFVHLLGGVDFRLSRVLGVGPFVDLALGQYSTAETKQDAGGRVTTLGGAINDPALHEWLTLGVRGVFLP
jgi:hypothetical protein